MKLVALLLVVATPALAGTLRAACDKEAEEGKEKVCVVAESDLQALVENNNQGWTAAEGLAERVQELEKQVKRPPCGTLTVIEPPRFADREIWQ